MDQGFLTGSSEPGGTFLFLVNTSHQVLRPAELAACSRPACRLRPAGALLRLHSENPPCFPGFGAGVAHMRLASFSRTGRKYQQLCISS